MCVEAFPEEVYEYTPQSGALGTIQEEGTSDISAQITAFNDQSAGWTTKVAAGGDATMDTAKVADSSLGAFLERPTRIATYSWAVGQPIFEKFNPWDLFLSDPRVAEKIANFELYRSKLHVKMVISGTGFHYGRSLVSYNPYSGFDGITTQRNFLSVDLIAASQKPHFFLNPTNNTGGELDLPFFWQDNYLSLSDPTNRADLGEITIKSMTNLQHANEGDDAVTITVFAWASDVILTMPTSLTTLTAANYTPQSGIQDDEYGKGIISSPASAVAHAAGKLTDVPGIAPYARATEIAAGAVRDMAVHFGYSRPPVVSDIVQQKPSPAGNLTNTDAADAVQKLSLDSKQELTVDSRTTGLDGEDQMDITRFCQRESYLTQFTMNPTEQPDTLLWNTYVTPTQFGIQGDEIHPTPMGFMSTPFDNWQGSLKYRFQVVKSNFHKGRILVRWDPRSHGAAVQYNTVYSRVIDLAETDDFEITVGWGQSTPFLSTGSMSTANQWYGVSRLPTDDTERFNGVLEVAIINSLVSPSLDSPIQFNVFVSACDDFKLGSPNSGGMKALTLWPTPTPANRNRGNPNGRSSANGNGPRVRPDPESLTERSLYEPQSGEADLSATSGGETDAPTNPESLDTIAAPLPVADQTMNVFFGESPTSIRELNRRYVKTRSEAFAPPTTGSVRFTTLRDRGLGFYNGYDPNGVDNDGTDAFNLTVPSFVQYFSPCYAGWRGSTRTKYMFVGEAGQPNVCRAGYTSLTYKTTIDAAPADAQDWTYQLTRRNGADAAAGAATTNLGINDTIEVEVPFYNGVRFVTSRMPSADFTNGCHSTRLDVDTFASSQGPADVVKAFVNIYKSVGEDFTFFFFTGCPIMYRNNPSIPS